MITFSFRQPSQERRRSAMLDFQRVFTPYDAEHQTETNEQHIYKLNRNDLSYDSH